MRNLTLNLGLRWAYTSPLVEKDNRQSNFDLVTGRQIFAQDGSIEERALYKPYYKGYEPRVGAAWTATDRLVFRGGYGISQFMEGTGANLRLPLNPPLFFESAVNYDATTGPGTIRTGFAELVPGTTPSGNVRAYDPNLRPQFTHQWNAFVEYRLTPAMSAQVGYVGHHASHLVTPVEGNQALAGRGRPVDVGAKDHAPAALSGAAARHHDRDDGGAIGQQVQLDAGQRPPADRQTAPSSWRPIRSRKAPPTTAASTACSAAPDCRASPARQKARIGRTRTTPRPSGARRSTTSDTISSSRPPTNCRSAEGRAFGSGWSGPANASSEAGEWAAFSRLERGSRLRSPTVATARFRESEGRSGRTASAIRFPRISRSTDGSTSTRSRRCRSGPLAIARSGSRARPGTRTSTSCCRSASTSSGPRYAEFRLEAFNALNHPSFGPPARDISVPNTFGIITNTISSPRVIELVLKFYF